MGATLTDFGHDMSGLEANLTTATNLLNADEGCTYFATDTKRLWVCTGSGVWSCVSVSNLLAPGSAGAMFMMNKLLTGMADNTPVNLAVVTIPNAIMGAGIGIEVVGTLGDGDSSEQSFWNVSFSRVAGAAAKIAIGAKTGAAATAGATANAAVTVSNTAVGGAVGATNTFQLQVKVARSAGASANHVVSATFTLLNNFGTGVTIA